MSKGEEHLISPEEQLNSVAIRIESPMTTAAATAATIVFTTSQPDTISFSW
jgi:hypothetical protein